MRKVLLVITVLLMACPVGAQEVIRVSYNSDWPPYSFGVGENVRGVLPDLMTALFEERLGIKVIHGGFPWVRAQEVVKAGEFDAIVTFPSDQRLEYADPSENIVYHLNQRAIVQIGSEAEKDLLETPHVGVLNKYRVCAMIGDSWSANFYEKHHIEFKTAKDTQTCLRLVASGRMDVFLHMEAAALHNMRLSGTTDKLHHLPRVMAHLPFTLLVSKQMERRQDIIARFDKMVSEMRLSGAYETLISSLDMKIYNVD